MPSTTKRNSRRPARNNAALAAAAVSVPMIEAVEERVLFSTFVVNTTADGGAGSFRDAINRANSNAGADVIEFRIGTGLKTITPLSALPQVTGPTTINATTQGGYAGKPLIEVRGDRAGSYSNGIVLTGGASTVKGSILNRFGANGVLVISRGGNTIANCYVGTDASGTLAAGNRQKGMVIQASNNTIDKCVISATRSRACSSTRRPRRQPADRQQARHQRRRHRRVPNGTSGIAIYQAASNRIGGTSSSERNVISGNNQNGVVINGSGAKYNTLLGNYIGLNAAGTAKVPNANYGVEISQPYNTVGGTTAGARNVISGNKYAGVVLWLSSGSNNKVQGNYIGTDYTGTKDLGNAWRGIDISNGSSNNVIGGATSAERNVISGNDHDGVRLYQGSNNKIQGNYIGLAANGSSALPNAQDGVRLIECSTTSITGNRIGYNGGYGVNNWGGSGTTMSGNTLVSDALLSIRQA
jgi:hypothetical protein